MKIPRPPHPWRLSPKQAIAVQQRMRGLVTHPSSRGAAERVGGATSPRFIAGLDGAFTPGGEGCIAGVVLWDAETQSVVEQHTAVRPANFPYIPGLLSFREVPAWLAALRRLRRTPEALMCDGHGFAHPRRFGIACHVGVLCGLPTIGCAKSRLVGAHIEPELERGARVPLSAGEERLGTVLRTQTGIRPVYVSIGDRIDLAQAEEIVLRCATRYRLPEPTRLADQLVAAAKRRLAQ